MPNTQNTEIVKNLRGKIAKAKSVVIADYKGLNVNQVTELRDRVSENGAEMTIAKNTLLKIALEEENVDTSKLENLLKGPTAAFFSYEDAIAPIKAIFRFNKDHELPTVKAGIVEGKFSTAEEVRVLSELPSKEELIARIVGGLKSPLNGFVNVLGGSQRKLVYALAAIAEKKEVS